METVRRIRYQSVYNSWPTCFCCDEPFTKGYELQSKGYDITSLKVCEECLNKAKKSTLNVCIDGEIHNGGTILEIDLEEKTCTIVPPE